MGRSEVERHFVSPVALNLSKIRESLATPSVHSNGSELECSSPLFLKSRRMALEQSCVEAGSIPAPELVSDWRRNNMGSPSDVTRQEMMEGKHKDLEIWEDASSSGSSPATRSEIDAAPSNALKDITNIHYPGYLQHNSFFQDAKAQAQAVNKAEDGPVSNVSVETTSVHDSSDFSGTSSTPKPMPDDVAARDADLAYTLAVLEGRITTNRSPSPIKRFVNLSALYSDDVLLDWEGPELHHPQPLRMLPIESVLGKMEQAADKGIDTDDDVLERDNYGADGKWIDRRGSLTPRRGNWRYAEDV